MHFKKLVVALLAACTVICTAQQALNDDSVIKLHLAGLSDDLLISTISSQPGSYALDADSLIALKKAGISDRTINVMFARNSGGAQPIAASAISPGSAGQNLNKVQEPEYIGAVFYLDSTGALAPLERQKPNYSSNVKAFGFGGAQGSTVYSGSKSPVRFMEGQNIQFIVRLYIASGMDPSSVAHLDVLKISKDKRSVVTVKAGLFTGAKTLDGESQYPLKFSKYGEQSFAISPAEPLAAGEYAITTSGEQDTFLFGIDPK